MIKHKHDAQWDPTRERLSLYEPGTAELHGTIIVEVTGEARWECALCSDRGGWFQDEAGAWGAFLDHEQEGACPA